MELADCEFLEIRKKRSEYKKSVEVRFAAAPNVSIGSLAVDPVSLQPFIERDALLAKIDSEVAEALGGKISGSPPAFWLPWIAGMATRLEITKLDQLTDWMSKYEKIIPAYVERCKAEIWQSNPLRKLFNGMSIIHLMSIHAMTRGPAGIAALSSGKPSPRQIMIAKEVFAKFGK